MDFPPEIVERILTHLDGKSLVSVGGVNKNWNREVERQTKKLDTWKRCIKEIPKNNFIELATNLDLHLPPPQLDDLPSNCLLKDLHSVYVNWWLWTHLARWSTSVISFSTTEEVTCAKLSGNCVVTGHSSGEIRVWSLQGAPLAFGFTHQRNVTGLLLVALDPKDIFPTKGETSRELEDISSLPGMAHHCVISTSLDEHLAITYFSGTVRADGLTKFGRPDDILTRAVCVRAIPTTEYLLVVIQDGNEILGRLYKGKWNYNSTNKKVKLDLHFDTEFNFPGNVNIKTISCYPPKTVAALTTIDKSHSFIQINLETSHENTFTFTALHSSKDFMQDVNIFRADVCIWIENTTMTLLHVHCNDSKNTMDNSKDKVYQVRPALPAVPIRYLLHGPTLFIGTAMGSVFAFDARNLLKLELDKPLWVKHLNSGPIRALHVSGSSFGLQLTAATAKQVFCVSFNTALCMPHRSSDDSIGR